MGPADMNVTKSQKIVSLSIFLMVALAMSACGGGGGDKQSQQMLEITPPALDFSTVIIGQSASLDVTITNNGSEPVNGISGGIPSNAVFSLDVSTCDALLPGQSCSYTFRYTPATSGQDFATSISTTDLDSFDIELSGTAVSPGLAMELDISPPSLDFGTLVIGNSESLDVTLTNIGSTTISGISGGVPDNNRFTLVTDNCSELLPTQSCSYSFAYTPIVNGQDDAVSISTTTSESFEIQMTGSGADGALWVTPLALDFGKVGIGDTSTTQVVTITNQSTSVLSSFAGGAPSDSQFGAFQNCAGGVAAGASCQYNFTFSPTSEGVHSTTSNSSTSAGPFVIELTGTGVGPELWVTPTSIDFGPVEQGDTSATQTVTITNTGMATLTNFAGGAPSDNQFNATQNCAGGVAPGASCQYFITFTPAGLGDMSSTSNTGTNAGGFVIELNGTGVAAAGLPLSGPQVSASPLAIDFGPVGVGDTSPTQIVTITNNGDSTLTSFAGGAPFDSQFSGSQNCAGGVAPGASCQYNFTFSPTAAGIHSTTSNSSTNAGQFVIELTGTGVGPELWVTPTHLSFGTVVSGATAAQQIVTISNIGLAPLSNFAGGAPLDNQFNATQNCASGVAAGASCNYFIDFTPTATPPVFLSTTSLSSTNAGSIVIELEGSSISP